jgi:hypothetical protein
MMPRITMPKQTFVSIALDKTHALWNLIAYTSFVGLKYDAGADPVVLDGVQDLDMLTASTAMGVVQYGGEVYDLPAWIVIADANMGDVVPELLPHGENTTWENWHDATHEHYQFGDNWYIQSCSWGEHLTGSQLLALAAAGYTIIDTPTYRTVSQSSEAPQ